MKTNMSYRTSHMNRGMDYHNKFFGNTHRAMMWLLEREVLQSVAASVPSRRMLDFACGTGRVTAEISDRFVEAVGVDVSESMLDVARQMAPRAHFRNVDVTDPNFDPGLLGKFELITAFRFFPNAEQELRAAALAALSGLLADGGKIVFNNHKNQASLVYSVASLIRGRKQGMTRNECLELIAASGLEVESEGHFGLIPFVDRFGIPFPVTIAAYFERALSRYAVFARWSSNIIFVCKKATRDFT